MSGNFTINSDKEIGAIDNPFGDNASKKIDKETKIFEGNKEVAEASVKVFEESSLKKKHKFIVWSFFESIGKPISEAWKKIFPQGIVSIKSAEKISVTNDQYVDLLGKIAEKMLKDNLWEEEGCFRVPGTEKIIVEAKKKLYKSCKNNETIQIDEGMSCPNCASLFKRCFYDFKAQVGTSGGDIVTILKQNKKVWKNISSLLRNVASSEITKLNQDSLKLAFPSAELVIKAVFADLAKSY